MNWIRSRTQYWLLFLGLFVLCLLALQAVADKTLIRLELSSSYPGAVKLYWTTATETNWSENRMRAVRVNERKQDYFQYLPVPLASIAKLRFDAIAAPGVRFHLRSIRIHSLPWQTVNIATPSMFQRLVPNAHVGELVREHGLQFVTTGNDAWFEYDNTEVVEQPAPWLMVGQSLLLALLLTWLLARLPWLFENLRWVPAGMLIAATSVAAMATVTHLNSHPDEIVHIHNAEYYARHYSPPEVCSPEARPTYSGYGVSRLDKREIAYYAAGRYLQLVAFIPGRDYLKLRYLNVILLCVLTLLAFQHLHARYLMLPLLLTPQAWYLFAYYNSDAFSLFFVVLTAYQIFVPGSMLRRLLRGERPPPWVLWTAGLSGIVAMQFWLKLNFMFYPIFLLLLGAGWWLLNRRLPDLTHARPLITALVLGSLVFSGWEFSRHAINDFELSARVSACQEQTAEPRFKPSTPLEQTDITLRLYDRGISLTHMLREMRWAERIFFSGLGHYGYLEYPSDRRAHILAAGFIILFFVYVIAGVIIRGDAQARMAVLATLASIAGVTVAAIINNWFQSFQPQGRYLLVYLPILGSLIVLNRHRLSTVWLSLLAMPPFLLGLYSFYAVGLAEIPS